MGRTADQRVAGVWRERLRRQRRSGLSVAEFCRREDVSDASFYAWRKRLSERGEGRRESPLFVPVELAGEEKPITGVQIELPGGAVVTLPAEASTELVTAAIRAAAVIEETESC